MRRTSFTVLVLAFSFVAMANAAPAMLAQANAPALSASASTRKSAVHARIRTSRHPIPRHPIRHASAHSSPCPAARISRRSASRAGSRKRRTSVNAHGVVPGHHLQARHAAATANPIRKQEDLQAATITETDAAVLPPPAPVAQPASLSRKRMVMPPPMRGSLTSLERQNEKAEAEGLERIEDEDDLSDRIARKLLVPIPDSGALTVNGNLPEHHRYCRPWTARFLSDLARAHAAQFHGSLEVSSAVRTVEYQKRLMAVNGNAAAAEGDIVSPHLTGATIDIAKSGLSRQEIGWMRYWLAPFQTAGKIDVEEEFQQACFHITVYKSYVPARPANSIAQARRSLPAAGQPVGGPSKSTPSKTSRINRDVASATPTLGR
jgi:hypothetical protein